MISFFTYIQYCMVSDTLQIGFSKPAGNQGNNSAHSCVLAITQNDTELQNQLKQDKFTKVCLLLTIPEG